MIDAYRIDNHPPASSYPYRVRVNGVMLVTAEGTPRKFRTLKEAIAAGRLFMTHSHFSVDTTLVK